MIKKSTIVGLSILVTDCAGMTEVKEVDVTKYSSLDALISHEFKKPIFIYVDSPSDPMNTGLFPGAICESGEDQQSPL